MLYEFSQQLAEVKAALELCKQIANGEAPDTLDLSAFDIDPAELASACFGNSGTSTVPLTIAQREAYEFVESHRRINAVASLTRDDYYARAEQELQAAIDQYTHLAAVLQRLGRKGQVP